jgi:ribosomal protein L18E
MAILRRCRRNVKKTLKQVQGEILKKPRRSLSEDYADQRISVVALKFAEPAGKKFRLQGTKR